MTDMPGKKESIFLRQNFRDEIIMTMVMLASISLMRTERNFDEKLSLGVG